MVLEAGVPIETFMGIVHKSSLRSPQFDKKLPRMLSRDFSDPHFPVSAMLKDVELIIGEAERMGLGTEMVLGIRSILERALEMGFDDVDYSAVYNAIHLHN
jgi:3-hydroxyisobutyrate dehydrogenase